MHACSGAVSVPLPTNIAAEDVLDIMADADCVALVVSLQEVPALAGVLEGCATLRSVIVMGR